MRYTAPSPYSDAMFSTPDETAISVTTDGSKTLQSARYGQTFHSHKGAVTEARHVFLEASGVASSLHCGEATHVLEVGYGTGLNFFLTADLALATGAVLSYTALEQDLLRSAVIRGLAYTCYLADADLLTAFLAFRSELPDKVSAGRYVFTYKQIRLELLVGEATVQALPADSFDAVYQDAFSPDANPELWTPTFFSKLRSVLKPGAALTTYSVKGEVRRCLAALGFKVKKLPGPVHGKREMLCAWRCDDGTTPVRAEPPGDS